MRKNRAHLKFKYFIILIITQAFPSIIISQNLSEGIDSKFSKLLIQATGEKISGDIYTADSLYNKCLELIPNSSVVFFEKSGICKSKEQLNEAIRYAEKAVEFSPKNEWYLANLALLYKEVKNHKKTAEIFSQLSKFKPLKIEYLFSLTEAYLSSNKIKNAIKILSLIEKEVGVNEEILIQKHQLYNFSKKKKKATDELKKLVAIDSLNLRNLGLLAEYYQSLNKNDPSLFILNKMMKIDSNNGLVRLSMFKHYYKNKNYLKGFSELKNVMYSYEVNQELKKEILSQISYDQNSPYTINNVNELTRIFLTQHPNNSSVLLFFGNLKFLLRQEDSACYYLRKALAIRPNEFDIWVQLISSNLSRGKYNDVIKDAEQAIQSHPNQPFPYFAKGLSLNIKKEYSLALKDLEKGKLLVIDNQLLESDFFHQIGEAYYNLNNLTQSFDNFEIAINLNPLNSTLLNNYSYYLAENKQNLDLAEKLIIKALEISPESFILIDTYGWVLFQKEQYVKAEELIFRAMMKSREKVGEILEHFGDVMFKLGKIDESFLFWEKAKKTGEYSKNLINKLKEKKYVD
tara:strand:+ start:559 stop:2277 length:1719 start_codon:yes stop_codon:yes gene_type:complete